MLRGNPIDRNSVVTIYESMYLKLTNQHGGDKDTSRSSQILAQSANK